MMDFHVTYMCDHVTYMYYELMDNRVQRFCSNIVQVDI